MNVVMQHSDHPSARIRLSVRGIAAQLDPLESDGKAYAARLKAAGNAVAYQLYPGVTHEFFGMGAVVNRAKLAEEYGAARIAASF